jgi:hypothetical protein
VQLRVRIGNLWSNAVDASIYSYADNDQRMGAIHQGYAQAMEDMLLLMEVLNGEEGSVRENSEECEAIGEA